MVSFVFCFDFPFFDSCRVRFCCLRVYILSERATMLTVKVMKRFAVVFILTAVLVGALIFAMPKNFQTMAGKWNSGIAYVYCRATTLPSVDAGIARIVQCDVSELNGVLARCNGVDGVSVSFDGSLRDVERIVRRLGIVETETQHLNGLTVICGRSARLAGGIWLDGRFVNVQIAYDKGTVTVGSPLILGSY